MRRSRREVADRRPRPRGRLAKRARNAQASPVMGGGPPPVSWRSSSMSFEASSMQENTEHLPCWRHISKADGKQRPLGIPAMFRWRRPATHPLDARRLRSSGPAPTAGHNPIPEAVHAASRSPTREPCAGNSHARFERRWGNGPRKRKAGAPSTNDLVFGQPRPRPRCDASGCAAVQHRACRARGDGSHRHRVLCLALSGR